MECGIHGQSNFNPANLQCCCGTEAQTGFVPTSVHGFRCRHLLDIEISILNAFLHPSIVYQCVLFVVLLPTDPSNNLLSSSPFVSQLSLEFPDPCFWISRNFQFDLLSPLRRTPLLQRLGLSSSEEWIQILQCDCQSEPPIPSCFFSRLVSSETQTQLWVSNQISRCTSQRKKSISRCGASSWRRRTSTASARCWR